MFHKLLTQTVFETSSEIFSRDKLTNTVSHDYELPYAHAVKDSCKEYVLGEI